MDKHGILLADKPTGMTSHDVVARVRRILKTKEVGHAGTLDPLASGLMALLIGEATKLSDYVLTGDKTYLVRVKLGLETDTLDITGQVKSFVPVSLDPSEIVRVAQSLVGDFAWPVPLYSAAKVDGRKLYDYARSGDQVMQPTKNMSYWDL